MLRTCIEHNYNLTVNVIMPAKRGAYGETWSVVTKNGFYFAKIHYMPNKVESYKVSLEVVDYLYNQNIAFINHVITTKVNGLYVQYNGGILALFDYIKGENSKQYKVQDLLKLLTTIYHIPIPKVEIEKEDFNINCADFVLGRQNEFPIIYKNIETLKCYYDKLACMRQKCKESYDYFYITHGDSASNIIINNNKMFIIDWDNVKVASPERDLWFLVHNVNDVEAFNSDLSLKGINYRLRGERLCFYCYYNYFYYFRDHLLAIDEISDSYQKRRIINYIHLLFFGGYIVKQMSMIERINHCYNRYSVDKSL